MTVNSDSHLAVLRRITERGLRRAQQREDSEFVDILQHMLDEIHWLETQGTANQIDNTEPNWYDSENDIN